MLKVALIEDEKVVLKGMTMVLQREKDVELVGVAEDGIAGLELISRTQPDVVFTDIRMPGRSGLEMIEIAQKEYPDIVYIIFSGFNEFKYVQRAIGMGVLDYLEKPVTVSDLRRVLRRAGEMVDYKRNYLRMKERSGQINRVLIEQILYRLLNQPAEMEEDNVAHLLEVGGDLEYSSELAVLAISKVLQNHTDSDTYRKIINKLTFQLYGNRHFEVFTLAQEENWLFVYFNQECEVFDYYGRIFAAQQELKAEGVDFYAGLSRTYPNIRQTRQAFTEALEALEQAVAQEESTLLKIETLQEQQRERYNNEELPLLSKFDEYSQIPEDGPVKVIKNYIDHNFEKSITLEMLAELVHMNPTYLSVIFKRELGISYSNYLMQVRIREAAKLLEKGMKAKDVCNRVGYIDYRYFNRQFKKLAGMTPDTYKRNSILKENKI